MNNNNHIENEFKMIHGKIDIKKLNFILEGLPIEIRFIDQTGHLKFVINPLSNNYKIGEKVNSQLDFTNLPSMFDILERFRHNKMDQFERALKVDDQYFNLKLVSIKDNKKHYLGCMQITENITGLIDKYRYGGFIESQNKNLDTSQESSFHYSDKNQEKYRKMVEQDILDLNSDTDSDAISGASEI